MNEIKDQDLAIIGLSCRFPGAASIEAYHALLEEGRCANQRFSREQLIAEGLSAELIDDPNYIPATGLLECVEEFDELPPRLWRAGEQ